jgi:DNA sulfur modification protein DndC
MEFRRWYLEKLLQGQMRVQKEGPDPNMELIREEEIHEIQRIWRMEQGDWQNSAYQIYEKVTGKKLESVKDDLGGFGKTEEELLVQTCTKHGVPIKLVSKLLNAEFETQGTTRHSKIFGKIKKILSEEWRENLDEILTELKEQKSAKERVKPPQKTEESAN